MKTRCRSYRSQRIHLQKQHEYKLYSLKEESGTNLNNQPSLLDTHRAECLQNCVPESPAASKIYSSSVVLHYSFGWRNANVCATFPELNDLWENEIKGALNTQNAEGRYSIPYTSYSYDEFKEIAE
ncbi:hypothetical protein STEG23_010805, partial [Scotinomys teguina]